MKLDTKTLLGIVRIMGIVNRLKDTARSGWNKEAKNGYKTTSVENPERVAGHSFGVIFLVAILANLLGLNVLKAVIMAMLHDLPEAFTGDQITAHEKDRVELERVKEEEERKVMWEMLSHLPDKLKAEYYEYFLEFLKQSNDEARLVKLCDNSETIKRAFDYADRGETVDPYEFLDSYVERFEGSGLEEFLESIKQDFEDNQLRRAIQ